MIDGQCTPAFRPLSDLLAGNLDHGVDVGASVAVVHDGELVADLWGGEARPGVAWEQDTVVQVWSVTKTMAALAVLVLADRGEIDLDATVATYWPEFGAHGKGHVRVRQLLGHTSGVPGWSRPVTVEDLVDLELSESWLAEEEPWYPPGSAPAYQILNYGHLCDGVVRGATGRMLADVLREDVLAPLGAEFFLGVPESALDRCADIVPPTSSSVDFATMPPEHFLIRTIANPFLTMPVVNGEEWRRGAEVGAVSGHANARGIARAQSVVSHGGEVGGGAAARAEHDRADLGAAGRWHRPGARPPPHLRHRLRAAHAVRAGGAAGSHLLVDRLRRRDRGQRPRASRHGGLPPNRLVDHMVASPRTDAYVSTALACLDALD